MQAAKVNKKQNDMKSMRTGATSYEQIKKVKLPLQGAVSVTMKKNHEVRQKLNNFARGRTKGENGELKIDNAYTMWYHDTNKQVTQP